MARNFTCLSGVQIAPHGRTDGWITQPVRGTAGILWTAIFTTFIATFTSLCLNVPSRNEKWYGPFGRRMLWMGVAILGPEFVLAFAAGQRASARRSVQAFAEAGYPQWTLRHAFFADMGGIELKATDTRPFRINAKHIHWLVTNGFMDFPDITIGEIRDKSKRCTVTRVVSTLQISYLVLQCGCRGIQRLPVTTLELFALAIVVCTLPINWCWLHKPATVGLPIRVHTDASIAEILVTAGEKASRIYRQTPLDFIDDLTPSWSFNICTYIGFPLGPFERPISRFGNERFPDLHPIQDLALCLVTLIYGAIHLLAWNWTFPTQLEALLWRVSSLIITAGILVFWMVEVVAIWWRHHGGERRWYKFRGNMAAYSRVVAARERPPFPLRAEFWALLVLAIVYGAARFYLIFAAFFGLRSLEPAAFQTVQWLTFFPHV